MVEFINAIALFLCGSSTRMSSYPLERTTPSELDRLSQVLWWSLLCEDCQSGKRCKYVEQDRCLARFFEHYKCLTASYESDAGPGQQHALGSHEALFEILEQLKSDPDITRSQLTCKIFVGRPDQRPSDVADQERAINLAVMAMTIINCSAQYRSFGLLEYGAYRTP